MSLGHTVVENLHATLEGMNVEDRQHETNSERWRRLYSAPGGPLMGWLLDEANVRKMSLQSLAQELSVTVGYLAQMHCGMRQTANISREFAAACGVFLGVPAVVVMVVAGSLKLVDFVCATHFERWVHDAFYKEEGTATQLACGANWSRGTAAAAADGGFSSSGK